MRLIPDLRLLDIVAHDHPPINVTAKVTIPRTSPIFFKACTSAIVALLLRKTTPCNAEKLPSERFHYCG
jgi:hypothetical protein